MAADFINPTAPSSQPIDILFNSALHIDARIARTSFAFSSRSRPDSRADETGEKGRKMKSGKEKERERKKGRDREESKKKEKRELLLSARAAHIIRRRLFLFRAHVAIPSPGPAARDNAIAIVKQ